MPRRNRLTLIVMALVLAIAGVAATLAFTDRGDDDPGQVAQAQEPGEDRGITVDGQGQISVEPDTAKVVLGIHVEGPELDALREDANSRMDDVIQALQDEGIDENDIQTRQYDISVREEEPPKPEESRAEPDDSVSSEAAEADEAEERAAVGEETESSEESESTEEAAVGNAGESDDAIDPEEADDDAQGEASDSQSTTDTPSEPRITGYEIRQLIEVTVRDIDATGDVIDVALDAGANNVRGIRFEVEDRAGAIEHARELAVENAREKAEHLAELTGVELGAPLYIDERSPSLPAERMEEAAMAMDDAAGAAGAQIAPGESTISVNVNIIYAIE